ncbi:MAG: BrnT family toxin [Planctomycetota bacterium]
MRFEWDEAKNRVNIRKRRIDFVDLPPLFDRPMRVRLDARREYGEDRMIGIGWLRESVVVVVFVEKGNDTIRIISARKATRHERERFREEIGH